MCKNVGCALATVLKGEQNELIDLYLAPTMTWRVAEAEAYDQSNAFVIYFDFSFVREAAS